MCGQSNINEARSGRGAANHSSTTTPASVKKTFLRIRRRVGKSDTKAPDLGLDRSFSAAGSHGQGSHKRKGFSQTPASLKPVPVTVPPWLPV